MDIPFVRQLIRLRFTKADICNRAAVSPEDLDLFIAENDIEAELRQLTASLFEQHLSASMFDANVLGVAHLGSIDLVRKTVSTDGLILLQGDREEAATRYLYRAWKSADGQGRGLHFLRTYLQMLFPNECTVAQKWHTDNNYPDFLCDPTPGYSAKYRHFGDDELYFDGSWNFGANYYEPDPLMAPDAIDTTGLFLTSRIEITMGSSLGPNTAEQILGILTNCVPARLVIGFRFWRERVFSQEPDIDQWFFGDDAGNFGDPVLVIVS